MIMGDTKLAVARTQTFQTYAQLLSAVRQSLATGRERALQSVDREKVRTSWEVGQLILKHVLANQKRADYGTQVIKKLSKDLGISETELGYMIQFARAYPIARPVGQLPWAHYETLLSINNPEKRDTVARRAGRENWSRRRLQAEVRRIKDKPPAEIERLEPLKGVPGTYAVTTWQGKPAYDLGFSIYKIIPGNPKTTWPNSAHLYTYHGTVLEVIDGDTLWVAIDLGFDIGITQKLRLRGIDAPEVNSSTGQEAKKFLEICFRKSNAIVLTTSKSDKYDRYLADIYLGDTYINQRLLDEGLATTAID